MDEVLLELTYDDAPKTIQIYRGDRHFFLDGARYDFSSDGSVPLLFAIALHHPRIAFYDEILKHLRGAKCCISNSAQDAAQRFASKTTADLKQLPIPALLRNIRNKGYSFSNGWSARIAAASAPTVPTVVDEWVRELSSLADRCVRHCEGRELVTNAAGLMYISADLDFCKENFILLNRTGWLIIHGLSLEASSIPDVVDIKVLIERLMSYVLFWRIGDKMSAEEWRSDFRNEILKITRDIVRAVRAVANQPNAKETTY